VFAQTTGIINIKFYIGENNRKIQDLGFQRAASGSILSRQDIGFQADAPKNTRGLYITIERMSSR
jgi:hypothetical protein